MEAGKTEGEPIAAPTARGNTNRHPGANLVPRVLQRADRVEVWVFDHMTPVRRIASLNRRLLIDARCHGQDLLDDVIGSILREIERYAARA